jgi:hypothetical protein
MKILITSHILVAWSLTHLFVVKRSNIHPTPMDKKSLMLGTMDPMWETI